MPPRLRYPEVAPEGFAALSAFGHYLNTATSLEPVLKGLVDLRASQINGCEFCTAMHQAELRKHHEPASRVDAVASWSTSDAFTPRERAALAWTETLTNLPAGTHASEADYAAVSEFFREKDLVDLTYVIANINAWNRLGVAFRPMFHATPQAAQHTG
jgi:AhpD family alkylhydroperoxidase